MEKLQLKNRLYCFPSLAPGEDIYSGLTRLFAFTGFRSAKTFSREVLGKSRVNPVMPQVLSSFNLPEAALENTVYPYLLSTLPVQRQNQALSLLLQGKSAAKLLGLNNFKGIKKRERLKWCSECYLDDLEQFGIPTYKSIHQIAGIEYCPDHGCRLLEAPGFEYPLLLSGNTSETEFCPERIHRMLYTVKEFKGLSKEKLTGILKEKFIEEGLVNPKDPVLRLNRKELFNRLELRYGTEYLKSLGLFYESSSRWTRNLLTEKGVVPVVLYLMLFDTFNVDLKDVNEYIPDGTEFNTAAVTRKDKEETICRARLRYKRKTEELDQKYLENLKRNWPELIMGEKVLTRGFLTEVSGCKNFNTLNRYYPKSAEFIASHCETYEEGLYRIGRNLITQYYHELPERKLKYHVLKRLGYNSKSKEIYKNLLKEMDLNQNNY